MDKRTIFYVILLAASFYLVQVYFGPKTDYKKIEQAKEEIVKKQIKEEKQENPISNENYYVLENEYQQLVFSNIGGALVEINLPLKTDKNKSVVLSTEFDKDLKDSYPNNAYFPQDNYFSPGINGKQKNKLGGYYPLIRRSIYNTNGDIANYVEPRFYALQVLDEDKKLAKTNFRVSRFEKNLIEFTGSINNKQITKTYFFDEKSPYMFNLKLKISGDTKNLWISSGVLETELISNRATPSLKYKTMQDSKSKVNKISLPKAINESKGIYVDWISNSNGFFGLIIDPIKPEKPAYKTQYIPGRFVPTKISVIDAKYNLYPSSKYPGYETFLPVSSDTTFRIFAGPYEDHILKLLDQIYEDPLTGYSPDFIKVKAMKGWFSFASEPFSKFLLIIMKLFYSITRSWGLSIILLTIVFRIMLFPLNSWSIKSTMKMQEITPLLKVIDAKYKKDPKRANVEKMKVFKDKGANPLSGCLPILIQLPFLFGMFNLLRTTFDLRGASFIPGWIDNLTSPDVLFSWNYPIFFIGSSFHLLPVLLGVVMFIQSKMNVKTPSNGKLTDQQKQQKMMGYMMPVLFFILFYKAASGLNIYFLCSMFLGIVQQWYMAKQKKI